MPDFAKQLFSVVDFNASVAQIQSDIVPWLRGGAVKFQLGALVRANETDFPALATFSGNQDDS